MTRQGLINFLILSTYVSLVLTTSIEIDKKSSHREELLIAETGKDKTNSKTRTSEENNNGNDDEDKKTLSQQVKEGKYGLIQNEIHNKPIKRPGIISYSDNPEVPRDTLKTLGGLDKDEIWLAENHMLVLRGGKFPEYEEQNIENNVWPAIDDYKAPKRQVKIPSKPKIPPPFPIQLKDNGPIQLIASNGTKTRIFDHDFDNKKGIVPGDAPFFALNSTKGDESNNSPPIELYHALPPGAVFVPPPANINSTDYEDDDDDDQSIYYPPAYSFHYKQDNSTPVPPGPLVPGIILPPPPDFFSPLDDGEEKKKPRQPTTTRKPTTVRKQLKTTTFKPNTYVEMTTLPMTPQFKLTDHVTEKQKNRWKTLPLTSRYEVTTPIPPTTTTTPLEIRPAPIKTTSSYYFYEEQNTPTSTESPSFIAIKTLPPTDIIEDKQKKHYYNVDAIPLFQVPDNYNRVLKPYYQEPQIYYKEREQKQSKSKPIYQYSFEASNHAIRSNNNNININSNNNKYNNNRHREIEQRNQLKKYYSNPSTSLPQVEFVTANPQHAYFTRNDEKLFDDVTKEYFTIFGKKLIENTTPIYGKMKIHSYVENYRTPKVNVHYGDQTQRPYSLNDDTLVNYKHPLPEINPESERVILNHPRLQEFRIEQVPAYHRRNRPKNYLQITKPRQDVRNWNPSIPRPPISLENDLTVNYVRPSINPDAVFIEPVLKHTSPISLENDIALNYRDPRPPINPDAEFIKPLPHRTQIDKSNSYFAYQLPDGTGHFYFLTPQAINQRQ